MWLGLDWFWHTFLLKFDWFLSTVYYEDDVFACLIFFGVTLPGPLWVRALFIHDACSSPNRIGDMPLLDRWGRDIGVILIVELLTYTYLLAIACFSSACELSCWIWHVSYGHSLLWGYGLDPSTTIIFLFAEVEKTSCYIEVIVCLWEEVWFSRLCAFSEALTLLWCLSFLQFDSYKFDCLGICVEYFCLMRYG
jgi:hypothetical protein